jgi:hypothetical protein
MDGRTAAVISGVCASVGGLTRRGRGAADALPVELSLELDELDVHAVDLAGHLA